MEEIQCVMEQVKKDGEHQCWDTLFGWSPTATGILSQALHPFAILSILILLLFVPKIPKDWIIMKQLAN